MHYDWRIFFSENGKLSEIELRPSSRLEITKATQVKLPRSHYIHCRVINSVENYQEARKKIAKRLKITKKIFSLFVCL